MKLNRARLRRDERTFEVSIEQRAEGDGEEKALRIVGHPIVYNRWSQDLGGFRERVLPGFATKALQEDDIRALFNHDPSVVLGRNKADTLVLTEGPTGVRMELFPPDTTLVRDMVIAPMERGDVNQMSFAFRTVRDEWREPKKDGGLWERDLLEGQLWDVSVVTYPAYTQTDAAVRSALTSAGIGWDVLSGVLTRADRGVDLSDIDVLLLRNAIDTLSTYIPVPSEPEPVATTHDEPQAGRSIAHLTRLLDLRAREIALN
jgi:hypothetical protein